MDIDIRAPVGRKVGRVNPERAAAAAAIHQYRPKCLGRAQSHIVWSCAAAEAKYTGWDAESAECQERRGPEEGEEPTDEGAW